MLAVVTTKPGGLEELVIQEIEIPKSKHGWVTIRVKSFGINRAEMFTRQGLSPGVHFPRILGIECVGLVEAAPGVDLKHGQTVAAIMGGMGREFNGSYAEYTIVPKEFVHPINTNLDWKTLGAIPEMHQTAYGALRKSIQLNPGQTILIRGGTSSVGIHAALLAKSIGASVISSTRTKEKISTLKKYGVEHVLIDNNRLSRSIRDIIPSGVDAVLDLVGTKTLSDSLQSAKQGGIVCMAGILANEWTINDFSPMSYIPSSTKLTIFSSAVDRIATSDLQSYVRKVEEGETRVVIDSVFDFPDVVSAHKRMESGAAVGKMVVVLR